MLEYQCGYLFKGVTKCITFELIVKVANGVQVQEREKERDWAMLLHWCFALLGQVSLVHII